MTAGRNQEEVFAILRWDGFHVATADPQVVLTVKEVVRSREIAEAEVRRLMALNESKSVQYWFQLTRLFPAGESAGGGAV